MYYDRSDGRLHMGQSTATPLPAPGADTFDEVPLTGSIGLPAYTRQTAGFSVTNDKARRSLGGKLGDMVVEGNLVPDWDEDVHNAMFADASAAIAPKRNWYIDYASGRRVDFQGFVSNWAEEAIEAGDEATEGRVNWAINVDGAPVWTPAPPAP